MKAVYGPYPILSLGASALGTVGRLGSGSVRTLANEKPEKPRKTRTRRSAVALKARFLTNKSSQQTKKALIDLNAVISVRSEFPAASAVSWNMPIDPSPSRRHYFQTSYQTALGKKMSKMTPGTQGFRISALAIPIHQQ
ncbi:hypothetical protein DFJ58DRAFT_913403 [Suillus subalutaceus]|uniref:uncharacterized protein n=1 Tax=Suillus subalutaceus TaxID=48586 RepID=UPI001B882395|nr:uncharacterized protein DFJ58DRAFT_913403 [Suillus subalutaceus]KAG1857675.1 hypothetical protein DFJ58DRAFT_913403 [Suillus subalutaceus]